MKRSAWTLALILALLFTATPTLAKSYSIDGAHSSAIFRIKHFGTANFYGTFTDVSGTVVYDPANPDASSIEVTIAAGSVDTRNNQRDDHVKSPDFLNAGEFKNITFKSTGVKASGDQLEVTGNLTLHGVTNEVTATVEKTGEGKNRSGEEIIGFETRFDVDRTEYDMGYLAGPLSKDIRFLLSLEAVAK